MKLHIERSYVEQMVKAFPHLESLQDQLRFGTRAEISYTRLNHQERDFLLDLYRVDDIDEAIVSRCIAMNRYHPPVADDRRQIWQVMSEQFSLDIGSGLIDQLVEIFPSATGRDIKGLTKLVAKFCRHKHMSPKIEVFKRCSVFRSTDCINA